MASSGMLPRVVTLLNIPEDVVLTRATLHIIPEDAILHSHLLENLKSYIIVFHSTVHTAAIERVAK
jgi:hypothetical protein